TDVSLVLRWIFALRGMALGRESVTRPETGRQNRPYHQATCGFLKEFPCFGDIIHVVRADDPTRSPEPGPGLQPQSSPRRARIPRPDRGLGAGGRGAGDHPVFRGAARPAP